MSFAYPEFLFALAAISVPIIIHLFNFRRFKKVYFSDIRFLKDVDIETKSRNKLKNLLILLSRILAITFLVMAFAQPFIPTGSNPDANSNSIVVYIDNSFSMNAEGENGSLLEEAKAKAIEVGSAYSNGSQIRLLTNDFDPQHFRDLTFEEFKNEVSAVQPSPVVRTFNEIGSRTKGMFDANQRVGLYYISDLQRNTTLTSELENDSLVNTYIIHVQSAIESNIYIDSCWFDSPTRLPLQPDELNVRVRNTGASTIENLSVKLNLNGIQRSVGTTTISAQGFEDLKLAFTNPEKGMQLAEVSLQDYPITYDDHYFISYSLASTINILLVNGDNASKSVANLFESEPSFTLTQVTNNNLDYSALSRTNLLVLNEVSSFSSGMVQETMKFVENGGSLLFIASDMLEMTSTNELLLSVGAEILSTSDSAKLNVEGVNLQSELFKNVFTDWKDRIDMPAISKYYSTKANSTSSSEILMTLANGQPLLTAYAKGKGKSYVVTTSLHDDWTNFHRHALFVPTLYNIALNSSINGISAETIGSNELILTDSKLDNSEILEMQRIDSKESFVPERVSRAEGIGVYVHNQVQRDGHFLLKTEQGATIQSVSFNYNRTESDLEALTAEELIETTSAAGIANIQVVNESTEALAGHIKELHNGKQLWRLFLILALACLLFETVLIRIL